MKVDGSLIKGVGLDASFTLMEQCKKDSGKMVSFSKKIFQKMKLMKFKLTAMRMNISVIKVKVKLVQTLEG